MKLVAKFNLVLVGVCSIGLAIAGYLSYNILQKNAREEVVQHAGMMMEAALAIRSYTVGEIRPLLKLQMTRTFLPQTVPAYAATQSFDKLRKNHPEYSYKEATLNPTNLRDRAADWEADIVQSFRNNPDDWSARYTDRILAVSGPAYHDQERRMPCLPQHSRGSAENHA